MSFWGNEAWSRNQSPLSSFLKSLLCIAYNWWCNSYVELCIIMYLYNSVYMYKSVCICYPIYLQAMYTKRTFLSQSNLPLLRLHFATLPACRLHFFSYAHLWLTCSSISCPDGSYQINKRLYVVSRSFVSYAEVVYSWYTHIFCWPTSHFWWQSKKIRWLPSCYLT